MKKQLLIVLLIIAGIGISTNSWAQYDCWSIQAKGGINTIRGMYTTQFNRDYNPEFGLNVEYTISPIIGIGSECIYLNNNHDQPNNNIHFNSSLYETTLFTSINLTNLSLKYRSGLWQRFNMYANLGAGFGSGSDWKKNNLNAKSNINLAASMGFNFEYNINRLFAVGFEVQYWWNSNGWYNPTEYSGNKDFYTGNLNFRFKIPSWNGEHIRNLDQLWNKHI